MRTLIDYKSIVENLSTEKIINLLTALGAEQIKQTTEYIVTNTICHNADSCNASMKLYYYPNTKLFICYTHCEKMSIFNFLKNYYEARKINYDWYNDIVKVAQNCSNFSFESFKTPKRELIREKFSRIKREKILPEYNIGVLDSFTSYYPIEWEQEGISKTEMKRFNISFSISQNKIIIPHFDVNGRLVGIRGRALDKWEIENVGKYMPIKIEETWYKHPLGLNLYGLYENKEDIIKKGYVFVFEGEKSVLKWGSLNGLNNSVAVCGSQFNKFQLNLLLKTCSPQEIIFCFDKEQKDNSFDYFDKLWNTCKKYNNYCKVSFIYDMKNLLELKDAPVDKGKEIFKKLVEKRVVVK